MVRDQMQVLFQHPTDGLKWDLWNTFFSKLKLLLAQEKAH